MIRLGREGGCRPARQKLSPSGPLGRVNVSGIGIRLEGDRDDPAPAPCRRVGQDGAWHRAIAIIGGGSVQWAPKLLRDIANTPSLHGSEVVIEDIDAAVRAADGRAGEHIAEVRRIPLASPGPPTSVRHWRRDFVVVAISTGGICEHAATTWRSRPAMAFARPSVTPSGPGGMSRALRNIPVLVGVARDMEELCPDAWLLNVTNPMTTLCRAVTEATSIRTVGLCHEITITHLLLSLLLDASYFDVDMTVAGVNHFRSSRSCDWARGRLCPAAGLLEGDPGDLEQPLAMELPEGILHGEPAGRSGPSGTSSTTARSSWIFSEGSVSCPESGDRHVAEFFSDYLTEESEWGERWGVQLVPIEVHERSQIEHRASLHGDLASGEVSHWPSGELVAPLIDSLLTGTPRPMPLNIPNDGSVADLPDGCRRRDDVPGGRQRRTGPQSGVAAAVSGTAPHDGSRMPRSSPYGRPSLADEEMVLAAMQEDPLASRMDGRRLDELTDELLRATKEWLPRFW